MSAYTTLTVSRATAMAKLAELRAYKLPTNDELEEQLDAVLAHTLYNFNVVDSLDQAEDDNTLLALEGKKS